MSKTLKRVRDPPVRINLWVNENILHGQMETFRFDFCSVRNSRKNWKLKIICQTNDINTHSRSRIIISRRHRNLIYFSNLNTTHSSSLLESHTLISFADLFTSEVLSFFLRVFFSFFGTRYQVRLNKAQFVTERMARNFWSSLFIQLLHIKCVNHRTQNDPNEKGRWWESPLSETKKIFVFSQIFKLSCRRSPFCAVVDVQPVCFVNNLQ